MAQHIVKLTAETNDYERKIRQANKSFKEFTNGIGLSIPKLTAMSAAIGATSAALKVAKDAFFKNEQNLDEWGRTVQSSKSLYQGFLNSLNNGDVSGFISNIGKITRAAREAYDAMDALGTFNAFNQINVEKTRTGMNESIASYREGTGSKQSVQSAANAYKKELQQRQKFEHDAYVKAVNDVAAQRGINGGDLLKALSGSYGNFQQLQSIQPTGQRMVSVAGGMFGGRTSYIEKYAQNDRERLGEALRKLNDTEIQSLQALGAQAQRTGNEIAQVDKQIARVVKGNASGGGGGGTATNVVRGTQSEVYAAGSIDAQTAKVQELQKAWRAAADDNSREKYRKQIEEAEFALDILMGKTSGLPKMDYGIGDLAGSKGGGMLDTSFSSSRDKGAWMLDEKAMRKVAEQTSRMGDTAIGPSVLNLGQDIQGGLSQIVSGIEQMGISIPQEIKNVLAVTQGMLTVLTGIGSIVATIMLIKQIETMKSFIPFFAHGGLLRAANGYYVPGTHFSGDRTLIAANAGELILNRAQQGNIASQLGGLANRDLELYTVVDGDDMRIVLNRNSRKRRKGDYVTSKRH